MGLNFNFKPTASGNFYILKTFQYLGTFLSKLQYEDAKRGYVILC